MFMRASHLVQQILGLRVKVPTAIEEFCTSQHLPRLVHNNSVGRTRYLGLSSQQRGPCWQLEAN